VFDVLGYGSGTDCTGQGNHFELIPMAKMETRHPIEGLFGSECSSIFNHCRFMAAWSCKTQKKCLLFLHFLEKRPLMENFSKSCSKRIHCPIDRCALCANLVKCGWWEIGKVVRYLPDKKFFPWLSHSRFCTDHTQNLPGPAPDMYSECTDGAQNRTLLVCGNKNTTEYSMGFSDMKTNNISTLSTQNICFKILIYWLQQKVHSK